MKILLIIVIILLIGGFLIIANNNLVLNSIDNFNNFLKLYFSWLLELFNTGKAITGEVIKFFKN